MFNSTTTATIALPRCPAAGTPRAKRLPPGFHFVFVTAMTLFSVALICPAMSQAEAGMVQDTADSAAQPSPSVELRWQFAEGDQYRIELDQKSTSDSVVVERAVKIVNRVRMQLRWEVADVAEDGSARLVQVIDSVEMTLSNTNPEGSESVIRINTAETSKDPVAKKMLAELQPLMGQKVFFRMTARGEIQDFEIPDETVDALRESDSSMQLRQIFTAEGMQNILGPSAVTLPEKAVAANDSWTQNHRLPQSLGPFESRFEYRLKNVEQEMANIEYTSKISVEEDSDSAGDSEIELIEHSGNGTIGFNVRAGHLANTRFQSTLRLKTPYREMTIDATTRTESIFSFTKVSR